VKGRQNKLDFRKRRSHAVELLEDCLYAEGLVNAKPTKWWSADSQSWI